MWIESSYTYDDKKVSFKAEDVFYFNDAGEKGTYVVLDKGRGTASFTIQTPYEEFKKLVDPIQNFKKAWSNAMIQSPPVIVPLAQSYTDENTSLEDANSTDEF